MHSYVGTGYRFRRGVKCGLIAYKVPSSKKKKIYISQSISHNNIYFKQNKYLSIKIYLNT